MDLKLAEMGRAAAGGNSKESGEMKRMGNGGKASKYGPRNVALSLLPLHKNTICKDYLVHQVEVSFAQIG